MERAAPIAACKKRRTIQRTAFGLFGLVLAGFAVARTAAVLQFPKLDKPLGPINPDAWLRLTQVRQWIEGGVAGFFDHSVRHTNAPFGGVTTPWTRPVDAILALLYFLTPGSLAVNVRLMLAATWMGPLLCFIAVVLMTKASLRHFKHAQVVIAALLLAASNAYLADYFSPGDADHHGLLSTLWCGVLCLVTVEMSAWYISLSTGALLGCMIWVSPESLVLAAGVYALLGLEALFRPNRMTSVAFVTLGAAVTALAALFIERAVGTMGQDIYDSLSVVHVALLGIVAVAAGALALIYRTGAGLYARVTAAVVAGAGVLGGMWLVYPKFFQGPLVDADPFIFSGFLPNVTEIRSLWQFSWAEVLRELAQPMLAAGLVIAIVRRGFGHLRPAHRRLLLVGSSLLAVTLVLTIWEVRWEYYLQPVAIVLSAALLPAVTRRLRLKSLPRFLKPAACIAVVFALVKVAGAVAPPVNPYLLQAIGCNDEIRYVIQTGQVQKLFGDNNVTLFVPANAGGDVEFFTPYSIIASNYHREGTGLKDIHELESGEYGETSFALLMKRHVTGMLYCPSYYPERSWLFKIGNAAQRPDWLTPAKNLRFFDVKGSYIPKPVLYRVER